MVFAEFATETAALFTVETAFEIPEAIEPKKLLLVLLLVEGFETVELIDGFDTLGVLLVDTSLILEEVTLDGLDILAELDVRLEDELLLGVLDDELLLDE